MVTGKNNKLLHSVIGLMSCLIALNSYAGCPITLTTSTTPVTCNGGADGKAWVTANGSKPYTYAWNPSLSINDTIFSLSAGSYTVTVTDNSGCIASSVITVTQPP